MGLMFWVQLALNNKREVYDNDETTQMNPSADQYQPKEVVFSLFFSYFLKKFEKAEWFKLELSCLASSRTMTSGCYWNRLDKPFLLARLEPMLTEFYHSL